MSWKNFRLTDREKLLLWTSLFWFLAFCVWLLFFWGMDRPRLLEEYGFFYFLGLLGAIVANSTGAGGGIVFIPFFLRLGLAPIESLGTSFAMQCFGMTMGSFSWSRKLFVNREDGSREWKFLGRSLLMAIPASVAGILWIQHMDLPPPGSIKFTFRVFSISFGLVIFLITLQNPAMHRKFRTEWSPIDYPATGIVCLLGGMLTAWISVGVGELLAIYLILRRYSVMFAIASAVCISSITVLVGVLHHIETGSIVPEILIFAAAGTLTGGAIARHFAYFIGPRRLKLFFAFWVFLSGVLG